MHDFLRSMAAASARRAKQARSREPLAALRSRALRTPPPRRLVRHASGFDLIAEIKPAAPSSGRLLDDRSLTAACIASRAECYASAGAAAVSVVTEPTAFHGDLGHLAAASRVSAVPTMRKDFLVDPYQVFEARACGAGGVLLILRLLDDTRLSEMIDAAGESGVFVLVEAFDEADLERASALVVGHAARQGRAPLLLGVNCRDLATLRADAARLPRLARMLPGGVGRVAESGIETPADVAPIAAAGYDLALVGSALMRAADPAAVVAGMIARGRRARSAARVDDGRTGRRRTIMEGSE